MDVHFEYVFFFFRWKLKSYTVRCRRYWRAYVPYDPDTLIIYGYEEKKINNDGHSETPRRIEHQTRPLRTRTILRYQQFIIMHGRVSYTENYRSGVTEGAQDIQLYRYDATSVHVTNLLRLDRMKIKKKKTRVRGLLQSRTSYATVHLHVTINAVAGLIMVCSSDAQRVIVVAPGADPESENCGSSHFKRPFIRDETELEMNTL
jgi:hypothetical protein